MHQDFLEKLPANTKFFHPLPRDGRHPTLPFWLDKMELNGWDRQSQNGYFTRIVLLGMLGGLFSDDYRKYAQESQTGLPPAPFSLAPIEADFIEEVDAADPASETDSTLAGLTPPNKGMIIEGLAEGQRTEQIW